MSISRFLCVSLPRNYCRKGYIIFHHIFDSITPPLLSPSSEYSSLTCKLNLNPKILFDICTFFIDGMYTENELSIREYCRCTISSIHIAYTRTAYHDEDNSANEQGNHRHCRNRWMIMKLCGLKYLLNNVLCYGWVYVFCSQQWCGDVKGRAQFFPMNPLSNMLLPLEFINSMLFCMGKVCEWIVHSKANYVFFPANRVHRIEYKGI